MNKNKLQRKLSLVLAVALLAPTVTALPVFAETPENSVEVNEEAEYSIEDKFTDKILKEKVRNFLRLKPTIEITNKNILELTYLDLTYNKESVQNLNGLEYAKNLQRLKVDYDLISDYTPIQDLKHLEILEIWQRKNKENPIKDIDSKTLSSPYIKTLDLKSSEIESLESFKNLKNVDFLRLYETSLKNLEGIGNFTNLEILQIRGIYIQDLNAFKDTTLEKTLKSLSINDTKTKIEDASGLKYLQNLE